MRTTNNMYSLRILKLAICDCLGCTNTELEFSATENVHLILYLLEKHKINDNYKNNSMPVTPVVHAIQLLCTMSYPNASSLSCLPLLQVGRGSVHMTFEISRTNNVIQPTPLVGCDSDNELDQQPCTSQQALMREEVRKRRRLEKQDTRRQHQYNSWRITVMRRFDSPVALDKVTYTVNGQPQSEVHISEFHDLFFVSPIHSNGFMRNLQQSCGGNWMRVIHAKPDCYLSLKGDGNPFDTFAKLFERKAYSVEDLMYKLTSKFLMVNEATRLAERQFVLKVFGHVREMFEYITVDEYTVWFFVPRLNRFEQLSNVTVDDFDLTNVTISIKMKHDKSDYFWSSANHNIKDVLLVSFQLALAYVANQSVLFISNLEGLNEFSCMQYVTAAFMNSTYAKQEHNTQWICRKYLQRIVELCESLNLLAFIEYPGGLSMLSNKRRVVKCKQMLNKETGSVSWLVYPDETKPLIGIDDLTKLINLN